MNIMVIVLFVKTIYKAFLIILIFIQIRASDLQNFTIFGDNGASNPPDHLAQSVAENQR